MNQIEAPVLRGHIHSIKVEDGPQPYGGGVITPMYYYMTPNFIGSIYEKDSRCVIVRDAMSGEDLTKVYDIHYADAKNGYFVVQKTCPDTAEHIYSIYNLPITIEKNYDVGN